MKVGGRRTSKRVSFHQKYKIQARVAEHGRRVRRGKIPDKNAQKRGKSDPGLPNLYPMKEAFAQKLKESKEQLEAVREQERQLNREKRFAQAREAKNTSNLGGANMAQLAADAESRTIGFDEAHGTKAETDIQEAQFWTDGRAAADSGNKAALYELKETSKRAYYREFKKIVELADVVLEVLDARDPLGCRCVGVEERIMREDPNKRIILVLNKIDLVPRENVEAWLRYLRNEYPTVAFKCATSQGGTGRRQQNHQAPVAADMASDALLQSSECLGADTLMHILKNYCRNQGLKKAITVGIVGYPNVGKSSLINSLKRSRATGVGSTPGLTKSMQTVTLDKSIKLLDCPGIVFNAEVQGSASATVAGANTENDIILRNCVRIEQIRDPEGPVLTIVDRCQPEALMALYEIPRFDDAHHFLRLVAKKRGKLRKGAVADADAAARSVLQDWMSGKIPFYTQPPQQYLASVSRDEEISGAAATAALHTGAAIVTGWTKEFNLDEVDDTVVLDAARASASTANSMVMRSSAVGGDDAGMFEEAYHATFAQAPTNPALARSQEKRMLQQQQQVEFAQTIPGAEVAPRMNKKMRQAAKRKQSASATVDAAYDFDEFFGADTSDVDAAGAEYAESDSDSEYEVYGDEGGAGLPDTDLAMDDI